MPSNTALGASAVNAYFYSLEFNMLGKCYHPDRCSFAIFNSSFLENDCTYACNTMVATHGNVTVITMLGTETDIGNAIFYLQFLSSGSK